MLVTVAVYILVETTALIAGGLTMREMLHNTPPTLKYVWALTVAFELFALLMVLFNGLSRPRGGDDDLLRTLLYDGLYFFLVISGKLYLGYERNNSNENDAQPQGG
ncbi:hypothetical protein BU17DRAFT_65758 [Hysterangium stoloniferum]|nr:hypothetical protein BU17DRAFT_65758 [Hysterangium stoloniferum]